MNFTLTAPECRQFTVSCATGAYPIFVGAGLLPKIGEICNNVLTTKALQPNQTTSIRCAVVTDRVIAKFYGAKVVKALLEANFHPHLITIPTGEVAKDTRFLELICAEFNAIGLSRGDFIIALGGGVIGDVVGYSAGIFKRGIRYFGVPTTVTAQADSSIGGKTGVNTAAGKNLLGLFYPPCGVISDLQTLNTLPGRIFSEGFAEIIKHAALQNGSAITHLVRSKARLLGTAQRGPHSSCNEIMLEIIGDSVATKVAIVSADEFEQGIGPGSRATLNFGHTIGHALERCLGYAELFHGEAVGIGMIAAAWISSQISDLPSASFELLREALEVFALPTRLAYDVPLQEILDAMSSDKKSAVGKTRFVLLRGFGNAYLSRPGEVSDELVRGAINYLRQPKPKSS